MTETYVSDPPDDVRVLLYVLLYARVFWRGKATADLRIL
jgi:hypothetical protein